MAALPAQPWADDVREVLEVFIIVLDVFIIVLDVFGIHVAKMG